jgi:hypothetical protein
LQVRIDLSEQVLQWSQTGCEQALPHGLLTQTHRRKGANGRKADQAPQVGDPFGVTKDSQQGRQPQM